MRLAAGTAVLAALDILFRVVPCAAGIAHIDRQQHAGDDRAGQQAAERFNAEQQTHQQRADDGEYAGNDHFPQCGIGRDRDTGGVIGLLFALEDAGERAELAAHLRDHLLRGARYGVHRERGEQEREHGAEEQADDDLRFEHIDQGQSDRLRIGDEQRERGQRRRADGKALADGCGRVAHGIEPVGDRAHGRVQTGHLRNAAGVVRNGTVGVHGNGDAGGREHADGRERYAVQARRDERAADGQTDEQDRNQRGFHADG